MRSKSDKLWPTVVGVAIYLAFVALGVMLLVLLGELARLWLGVAR